MTRASNPAPWIIAVTGGIASGKSTVARTFGAIGGHVIDADRFAREVTDDPAVLAKLLRRFGGHVVDDRGYLDRKVLSRIVFADPDELKALEEIVHPKVEILIEQELDKWVEKGFDPRSPLPEQRPFLVLDIPLLEDTPFQDRVDRIVFVECDEEERLRRVTQDRGWTPEELERRESFQRDLESRRNEADHILPNPGSGRRQPGAVLSGAAGTDPEWNLADPESLPSDDFGNRRPSDGAKSSSPESLEMTCRQLVQEWCQFLGDESSDSASSYSGGGSVHEEEGESLPRATKKKKTAKKRTRSGEPRSRTRKENGSGARKKKKTSSRRGSSPQHDPSHLPDLDALEQEIAAAEAEAAETGPRDLPELHLTTMQKMTIAELHELAAEEGVTDITGLKKQDLIFKVLRDRADK
ncbi:MAG: dephospho-CoA kinase, partial [Planctomycetota bacterium]